MTAAPKHTRLPAAVGACAQLRQHQALAGAPLRVRSQQAPVAGVARRQAVAPQRRRARHLRRQQGTGMPN